MVLLEAGNLATDAKFLLNAQHLHGAPGLGEEHLALLCDLLSAYILLHPAGHLRKLLLTAGVTFSKQFDESTKAVDCWVG